MYFLINSWAYIAQRSMSAFTIIEHLNIFENIFFSIDYNSQMAKYLEKKAAFGLKYI